MIQLLQLANGKNLWLNGDSITKEEAHEIIIKLAQTYAEDLKQELIDLALSIEEDNNVGKSKGTKRNQSRSTL